MIQARVAQRARRTARAALMLGFLATVTAGLPWASPRLPAFVIGMFTLLPVLLGGLAIAGALIAMWPVLGRTTDPDLMLAPAQRMAVWTRAGGALVLGTAGALGGAGLYVMLTLAVADYL